MNLTVHWSEQLASEMTSMLSRENDAAFALSVMKLVQVMYAMEHGEENTDEEAVRFACRRLPEWNALIGWAAACSAGCFAEGSAARGTASFPAPEEAEAEAFARYAARYIQDAYFFS